MRVIQIRTRNPIVGAVVGLLVLLVVLAVLLAGATLLAGVAVVGGVLGGAVLLGRRVLGLGRRSEPALPPLDPANEVFPTRELDTRELDASREVFPADGERRQLPS
jgi:hypothetical protein